MSWDKIWQLAGLQIPAGKRPRSMLRSYQRYLSDAIFSMPIVYGAAEMSLGKTGATLDGIKRLLDAGKVKHVLILAPKRVASETWPTEIGEWAHLEGLTYAVAEGTEKDRIAAIKKRAQLTMMGRENIQWLWRHTGGRIGWYWDMLVYDEASRLKNWKLRTNGTATTRARHTEFGALAQARPWMKRVVELSGTPAPNSVLDLGGQIYIMDQGERLGRNITQFRSRYTDYDRYTEKYLPKESAHKMIMKEVKDIMIGLRAEDYIDLPPRVFNQVPVTLSPKILKQYRDFKSTLYADDYDVEAVNRGVLTNKLLQFSNGSMYRPIEGSDPPKSEIVHVHDEKIPALESIIEEANGENVLIAYSFKFDLQRILKKYPKAVVFDDEPDFVKLWNKGKIRIGVAHPASIGHGLNLQFGGFIQVWFGLTWSLELYDQFNRRLARPGQPNSSVYIHHIMSKGTDDFRQYEVLNEKGASQDRVTEAIRVILPQRERRGEAPRRSGLWEGNNHALTIRR